jgi:hypothetical protein
MPDHGPFSPDANPFLATSLFLPTVASCADYCARLPTCTDANYQTESKFCEIFISRADKEPVQTVHTERNEKYTRIQKVVAGASLLYTTAAPAKALRLWNRDMSGTDPVIPPPNYQHPAWNVTKPNTFSIENYPRFCWNEDEDPENGVLGSCGFGAVAEHASCQILCRYGYVPSRRAFTCVSMTGFDTPTIRDIVMRAPAQDPPRCIPVLDDEYHVALQMVPPAGVRDGTKGNLPFPIPVVPFSKIRKSIPQANQHVWEMVTSALEQETWQWIRDAPRIHPSAPNAPKLDFLWKRQYRRDRDGRVKWLDAVEPSSATHDALTADWPPRVIILNLLHRPERFHATLAELQAIGYPMDRVYRMEGVRADVGYAGWYASIMLILPWVAQQVDWENFLFLEDDVKWIGELDDTVQNINKLGRLIYPQNDADMSVRDDSGFDRWDSVSLGQLLAMSAIM